MNRIIKFRGKDLFGTKWLYGDLVQDRDLKYIVNVNERDHFEHKMVKRETIGQFTGLLDRNGKEIYEGDILELAGVESERLEVRFVRGVFAFLYGGNLDEECPLNAPTHCCVEVIGNIHDNTELLKGLKRKKTIGIKEDEQ